MTVVHEDRTGCKQAAAQARVAKKDMWRVILALFIVVIAISTTFNAVTVALPKLFAERLADMTTSPALLGVIAACVYVFGAMTQYTIGKLIDRYSLKAVSLPLSLMLAPFLYLAATLSNLPLILASIGIVMGAFGQVTVNDAMVGKYTSEEWRSRAYSIRYFIGFTAAGASVGLVAWLYEQGGFVTMLQAFGALCLLVIAGGDHPADRDQGAGGAGELILRTEKPKGPRSNPRPSFAVEWSPHGGVLDAVRAGRQRSDGVVSFALERCRYLHQRQHLHLAVAAQLRDVPTEILRRWCLHQRQYRHRLGSGLTGCVSLRKVGEGTQGAYGGSKHDDLFHLDSPVSQSAFSSEAVRPP